MTIDYLNGTVDSEPVIIPPEMRNDATSVDELTPGASGLFSVDSLWVHPETGALFIDGTDTVAPEDYLDDLVLIRVVKLEEGVIIDRSFWSDEDQGKFKYDILHPAVLRAEMMTARPVLDIVDGEFELGMLNAFLEEHFGAEARLEAIASE